MDALSVLERLVLFLEEEVLILGRAVLLSGSLADFVIAARVRLLHLRVVISNLVLLGPPVRLEDLGRSLLVALPPKRLTLVLLYPVVRPHLVAILNDKGSHLLDMSCLFIFVLRLGLI
jgi:hypothetical protein